MNVRAWQGHDQERAPRHQRLGECAGCRQWKAVYEDTGLCRACDEDQDAPR
jgi:hypothetical protein